MGQKGYLVLEDGTVLEGTRFGALDSALGELVFATGMTGYMETLSDPSYYGQMIVQTFPLIGNCGVIVEDMESVRLWPSAYIVREICGGPSNFRSQGGLDGFLQERGIPGLCGVDTRALTRRIRDKGVLNAALVSDPAAVDWDALRAYRVDGAVEAVTAACIETQRPPKTRYKVVLWDFGAKANITQELLARGCEVVTVPAGTSAEDILALLPDGVMLSNGPGDPADCGAIVRQLAQLCRRRVPLFGICLGHQLLALSQGAKTGKLKYGHRGANQPVRDERTGRVFVTSQNHGYAVQPGTLPDGAAVSHSNVNDGTCEGVRYGYMPAFSVQFHPEACGGPHDTNFLFDEFIRMMEGGERHAAAR